MAIDANHFAAIHNANYLVDLTQSYMTRMGLARLPHNFKRHLHYTIIFHIWVLYLAPKEFW
ncbi:hypothetical protein TSUD_54760 [Trifolium subterraneum]|uniref:Uncharacterized protein n=1 Tax=Trifolium subterraneum TaxID=3900 RepID=A0A2Z6M7I9_TRISU|nr:hypothetical protein TSUD_54760 [Trifolium subterraneum]